MIIPSFRVWILGVRSLALHPLRSLLTVLGVFVGTASVIWLLAAGEGIGRKAQEQIEELVRQQPDDSSYDEILRELAFARMVQRGLEDSRAGRTVSHEEMGRRIRTWRK